MPRKIRFEIYWEDTDEQGNYVNSDVLLAGEVMEYNSTQLFGSNKTSVRMQGYSSPEEIEKERITPDTGETKVIKNVEPLETQSQELQKALKAGGYNPPAGPYEGGPLEIVDIFGLEYRPIFDSEMIFRPETGAGCRCDIKDLMSTGHKRGCPEKK